MQSPVTSLSATQLADRVRRRELAAVEVVDAFLERIASQNEELNAFVTVIEAEAREAAQAADRALADGEPVGPLHGVPVAIKDLFDLKAGVPNSFGFAPFAEFVPKRTVIYVERLEAAGAIILGKTNTPEFGHKGTTDNGHVGPTATPFDTTKNAGGSSGGSAAAVAAGMVPLAQGTDGGGSLRIPATFCGVVGYKPSFGRIPQSTRPDAFVSHTPFIDVGPIARTVEDAALFVDAVAGPAPGDPWSLPEDGTDYLAATRRPVDDLQVAFSPDLGCFPVENSVRSVVDDAVEGFREAGATVDRIDLALDADREDLEALILEELGLTNVSVVESFASNGIDLLTEYREDLPPAYVEMVERAQERSLLEYKRSDVLRTAVYDAVQTVFDDYDLLVTPTVGVPAIDNADDGTTVGPSEVAGEPVDPLLGWSLAYPFNFTGHPAVSLPAGRTPGGVPTGVQMIAPRHDDETLLAASAAFERARPWHDLYDDL